MARADGQNRWDKIQTGVKDTERLIGQKDYNSAMVKTRQTLELMVKILAERAAIADTSDLMTLIDMLYQNRWISKTSCEHYHKLRMIGNKAVHEGDNNAYNANQAYHLLSQEVYSFTSDYGNVPRGTSLRQASRGSQSARSRRKSSKKRRGLTVYDLLKLLVPVLCIVLLILVIRLVKPGSDAVTPSTAATTATEAQGSSPSTETTTEVPAVVYKTTTTVNVRPQPNTGGDRIAKLDSGVTVEYVRAHDNEWAVILYEGKEAYIASQYLTTE